MKKSIVIAIVTVCCTLLFLALWRYSPTGSVIILQVESLASQASLAGMERIIQAQKKTIDLYTHLPKVVYRCVDDEPKIKYPKYASDDYTIVTMGTNDECGNTRELDAVIIVHTAAYNFDKRERFRKVYANRNATWPYKLKVVFLIGKVINAELQIDLEIENRQYGDTLQGNFLDTYRNLTLKAIMGYRWIYETCAPDYKVLLKMDDDVILDVHRFFGDFFDPQTKDKKKKRIMCQVWKNAPVNRSGKWKVEKGLYANASYAFPYCSGFFVAVTPDIVQAMYETAKSIDFFWIDDVFLYGMVPRAINFVGFTNIGGRRGGTVTQNYAFYKKCLASKKDKCSYLAIVISNGDEFFETFYKFPHQNRKLIAATKSNISITNEQLPRDREGKSKMKKPAGSDDKVRGKIKLVKE